MKISTSILSCEDRIKSVKKLNETNIDYLHIDVMDGKFVKSKAFTIKEIRKLSKLSNCELDVHLMVNNPLLYILFLKKLNIKYITFHLEVNSDIKKIIKLIKKYNYKVGIAIKPNTKEELLLPYINDIDMVLIMSVEPGYGGQKFIEGIIPKINTIKKYNHKLIVSVDGGINDSNIRKLKDVDIAVVGSFITNSNNYREKINRLKI